MQTEKKFTNPPKPAKMRVWNKNSHDLVETFQGKEITILAGKYLDMPRSKAILFQGNYHPARKNGMGIQTDESKKILELEPLYGDVVQDEMFICQKDNTVHKSQQALDKYIAQRYKDEIVDEGFAKEFEKKITKKR